MKYFIIVVTLFQLFRSCGSFNTEEEGKPLARVYDKYLYFSEVEDAMPSGLNPRDSIAYVKNFVDSWTKKQLMLKKAELNLNDEQQDVSKQLDDYRATLLVYKYQQKYVNQRLDTIIEETELEEFYNSLSSQFKLDKNIVKTIIVKIPKPFNNIYKIRKLARSDKEEDLNSLEEICFMNSYLFIYDDQWSYLNNILNETNHSLNNPEQFLKTRNYFESQDSVNHYFVKIRDYRLINDIAPLDLVRDELRDLMISKRKIRLINELQANIRQDAEKLNQVEIFKSK